MPGQETPGGIVPSGVGGERPRRSRDTFGQALRSRKVKVVPASSVELTAISTPCASAISLEM